MTSADQPSADRTIVSLASSTTHDYAFLIPLTALMWRDNIGFSPKVHLIGSEAEWAADGKLSLVKDALAAHGIWHEFVERLEGYLESTQAQNIRQHAACDPSMTDDAWLTMGDADLWPLRREWYGAHVGSKARAVIYYANGDHFAGKEETLSRRRVGLAYQSIPTCHVVMRVKDWREIYGLGGDARAAMKKSLDAYLQPKIEAGLDAGWESWMSDQRILTEKLVEQPWFPADGTQDKNEDRVWVVRHQQGQRQSPNLTTDFGDVVFVTRRGHPPHDRLDRSVVLNWFLRPYQPIYTDAHLHKAPYSDDHFENLMQIVEYHLPQYSMWARRYREDFVR